MDEFWKHLVEARYRAQESYDKTLVVLASGALGLSFTIAKEFQPGLGTDARCLMFLAWVAWASSLAAMLASYLTSLQALTLSIRQLDSEDPDDTQASSEKLGGRWTSATTVLNLLGSVCFVLGVIFFAVLVGKVYG